MHQSLARPESPIWFYGLIRINLVAKQTNPDETVIFWFDFVASFPLSASCGFGGDSRSVNCSATRTLPPSLCWPTYNSFENRYVYVTVSPIP